MLKVNLLPNLNKPVRSKRTADLGRVKMALFFSILIHCLGFLAAPFLFKSCNKKPKPKEVVYTIEFSREKTPLAPNSKPSRSLGMGKISPAKEKKLASVTELPRERFKLKKQTRRSKTVEKKSKKTSRKKRNQSPKIETQKTGEKVKKENTQAPQEPQRQASLVPVGKRGKTVKVMRQGKARSYVSRKIFSALDRIPSGGNGSSIYDKGNAFLPRVPGGGDGNGGECGAGGCKKVRFLGRRGKWYYWKDRNGLCYITSYYPERGTCFRARFTVCPGSGKGLNIF